MNISETEPLGPIPSFERPEQSSPAVGRPWLWIAPVAVVALVAGFFLVRPKPAPVLAEPASAGMPALTVTAAAPALLTWPKAIEASGAVAPWQEAIVGAQVGGYRLAEVRVNVGDHVKKGEVLARFDADLLRADENQLKASVAEAAAVAAQGEANLKRAEMLKTGGNLSAQDFLESQTQTATSRTRLDSARAMLASKQLQLGYTDVIAPDDGTISARTATQGAVVPIGQELFRMILKDRLEWRGELTAPQVAQIAPGQRIELSLPDGTTSTAVVREIAPTLDDQSRMGIVYADVDPAGHARAGMYAYGRVLLSESPALVVPAAAVVIRDGYSYVFKLTGQGESAKVAEELVTVGRRQGSAIEITKNLAAGERVVVQGAGFLNDGDLVRVVDANPAAAGQK